MSISAFFKKNWVHFAAIGIFLVVCLMYFNLQLKGYGLKQHDIEQYIGMAHEANDFREQTGEEAYWTNSTFGGMPTAQISLIHHGNWFGRGTSMFLQMFPSPMGIVLLYMIGFYLMLMMMRVNNWLSIVGSLLYAFLSYQIIILQAGHNSKGIAIAFMAPVVGAFYLAFRKSWIWGAALSAFFMSFELAANHLQVSYYLGILLLGLGIAELIRVFKTKEFLNFGKATAGVVAGYLLAVAINYGNIAITNDYAKHSTRGGNDLTIAADGSSNASTVTEGLDRKYVTEYSYGIGETFSFLSPYVKGAGTIVFGDSQFSETVENSDFTPERKEQLLSNSVAYWGDQPATSGPVYLGVIVVFLALLGLVYIKDASKWALLAVTILTVMLSWGKNYMGLTNWFLDNIPGYNKFRAVTIILVIAELCIPLLAVLLVNKLIKERDAIKENLKPFYITSAAFLLLVIGLRMVGIDKSYLWVRERDQSGLEAQLQQQRPGIEAQIMQLTPEQATQYGIDKSNPQAIAAAVDAQIDGMRSNYQDGLSAAQEIRKQVYNSSLNRSILFTILAIGCLLIFFRTSVSQALSLGALGILALLDVFTVTHNYLNGSTNQAGEYKYWSPTLDVQYPIMADGADMQILDMESQLNPTVKKAVDAGRKAGKAKAFELDATGVEASKIENAYAFSALNRTTNYRVYDLSGGFSSARASYFHKSLGGYHGAKLRNVQNLAEFHIYKSNNKVFDMLNVKYFLQPGGQNGEIMVRPNETALGNAWFVRKAQIVKDANEEILSLGSRFAMKNIGTGKFFVNGVEKKNVNAYGSERLQYLPAGTTDTIDVPLSNGIPMGIEVVFVQDINGKTDLIMKQGFDQDTTKSFTGFVSFKVTDEFKPIEEVLVTQDEAKKLKKRQWSGEGKIKLTSYSPNKLVYQVNASDAGMAVFSEVYYADGWTAKIDGKPADIVKVDYLLRGLEVPKGKSTVTFEFEFPKYKSYNTISAVCSALIILILIGLGVVSYRKKKLTAEK